MLQLNTTVTFSLRVPLGLGYTVLDTIRLPNVRLEMVTLNKKNAKKQQQQQKNKNKIKLVTWMDGKEKKKWRLFRGWGGHSPAPLMRISKQLYINHQKLFSFKTSRGNHSQFLWHVRYVNDLAYRKIPKKGPSMYKPPKIVTQKNPPLNRPSEYKPPGGLVLGICPRIQSKTKQKW